MRDLRPGVSGRLEMVVAAEHTADHWRNPGFHVLATPILCYWVEATCSLAIQDALEAGEATVGTQLTIEHLRATPLGMPVRVSAQVTAVNGRRVTFAAEAFDTVELIGRATHERFVVDLQRFQASVQAKGVASRPISPAD